MPRPRRNEQQVDLQDGIKETAWKQIGQSGAPTLSLRAIARELGITAPAIYNYFQRRDTSFGDWQITAREAAAEGDLPARMTAIGQAYRNWALAYPQRYQLIFGTPIPGYAAPMDVVFPSAARSLGVLVSVVEAVRAAGRLNADDFPQVMPGYEATFAIWKSYGGEADVLSLAVAVLIWSRVHGLVSLEIANNTPPFGVNGDALYLYELGLINKQFIREAK
jgi:AcrR family transcriptional regulator